MTAGDCSVFENVAQMLLLNVERFPNKTALICGQTRLTYREFNRRVNRLGNGLLQLGVEPGDKVAYMFPNSVELLLCYYAIQKIGAVAVPLGYRLIPREIAFLVNASDCRALLYDGQFDERLDVLGRREGAPCVEFFVVAGQGRAGEHTLDEVMQAPDTEPPMQRDPSALSRIQFTGGSTGIPKGVMRTHAADIAEILGVMLSNSVAQNSDNVVMIQCPLDHHGGHSWFTATLAAGGTLLVCEAFSPAALLADIEREGVTYLLLLPPSTYLALMDEAAAGSYDLSSVRLVQSSAGCTTAEITKRIYDTFPNCVMNYGWGQTESGLGTSLVLTREMAGTPRGASVGRPMPLHRLKIIDDDGSEVPSGVVGECVVKGPAVMQGYYKQADMTAKAFTKDGWMRTGDLMSRDEDGYYYIKARKKNMIKSGGENVFAGEVERVVREHPAVHECIVFGVPERKMGEAVMAVVQLRQGAALSLEELQAHCKRYLSSYKKPRYLDYIGQFEMDAAGKIRREQTAERYRQKLRREKRVARGLEPQAVPQSGAEA